MRPLAPAALLQPHLRPGCVASVQRGVLQLAGDKASIRCPRVWTLWTRLPICAFVGDCRLSCSGPKAVTQVTQGGEDVVHLSSCCYEVSALWLLGS